MGELYDRLNPDNPESKYPMGRCYSGSLFINNMEVNTNKPLVIKKNDKINIGELEIEKIDEVFPYSEEDIWCGLININIKHLLTPETNKAIIMSSQHGLWAIYRKGDNNEL